MKQIYDNKDIGDTIDKAFDAGIEEGYRRCREQMLKEAIVYVAQPDVQAGNIQVPFVRIGSTALFRYGIKVGDKIKIIIIKEDEK